MKLQVLIGLGLVLAAPARAEFVLRGAPVHAPAAVMTDPPPVRLPAPKRIAALPKAEGFGDQVPLAVAVRMIAPPGVAVELGESVDGEALVSWTGGRPWNLVLADAIRPHKLTLKRNGNKASVVH